MELKLIENFRGDWDDAAKATNILPSEDPFKLVEEDLIRTKEFALNNIVLFLR